MKIKVVDMTYEQALAQPPQVHKKPKKPSLLFRTVLRAASAPDRNRSDAFPLREDRHGADQKR